MNRKYELLYVLRPSLGEDGFKEMDERIQGIIEAHGEVLDVNVWGTRRLAYEINDYKEGYYVVLHFMAGPDFPIELERQLNINENVLRFLVTTVEQ